MTGAPALAQDDAQPDYEITVYGESALKQARWDTILAMKRLGWDPVDKSGGRTVFKPPRKWMGRATLDREGNLSFRYPVAKLEKVSAVETSDGMEDNGAFARDPGGNVFVDADGERVNTLPSGRAGLWLLPAHRILDAAYDKVRDEVTPELEQMARIKRDTRVRETLDRLPERLDALWTDGRALDGSGTIDGRDDRVEALLLHWGRQPDDFEGEQVTRATEAWMRGVLLDEVELTADQRSRAEGLRSDGRKLP